MCKVCPAQNFIVDASTYHLGVPRTPPGNLLVATCVCLGYHCIDMHLYIERKEDIFMDTWNPTAGVL